MNVKFKIVIPSYNSVEWLPDCLQSVENQKYKNYDVVVIDDASTDERQREIIAQFTRRNGWKMLCNSQNRGALFNIVQGIRELECQSNDVIFVLDGDDWLYDDEVLNKLNVIYANGDVDLTYGQYMYYPSGYKGTCYPVSSEVIAQRSYRRARWRFSQLRTFKYFLFNAIRDEDLRDVRGRYFQVTYDIALMFPMLEMVGDRFRFIEEILYVYNIANPLNDYHMRRHSQLEIENYLRQKNKYDLLVR